MKSLRLAGIAALAFIPLSAGAQTLRSTTTMVDPATGASTFRESATRYQAGYEGSDFAMPGAPVERPGYGASRVDEYERDLSAMTPAYGAPSSVIDAGVNDDVLTERRAGDINYITGGVGHAERDALNAMRNRYNFKLTNTETDGAFVSYTRLSLMDAKGRTVLDAEADPLFLAQLPAGNYTLRAEREGQVKSQRFQVKAGKPVSLQFSWM